MSKSMIYLVVAVAAVAAAWPAAAEIAIDQSSLRPIEQQLPDLGKLNRSRSAGASILVSRAVAD